MMKFGLRLAILLSLLAAPTLFAQPQERPEKWAVVIPTSEAGDLTKAPVDPSISFTTLGDKTVILGGESLLGKLSGKHPDHSPVGFRKGEEALLFSTRAPALRQMSISGARLILKVQGMRVFLADETAKMGLTAKISPFTKLEALPANTVVLTPSRSPGKKRQGDLISPLLDRLDIEAFKADVKALSDLKTRYTYSKGADAALVYCEKKFQELGLKTRRQSFTSNGTSRDNLEAVQPGFDQSNSGEVFIIAHLDSTSPNASTLAPGADDNGSGAAGVLALARFMKGLKGRAGVRFILVLGEEQGMLGSKAYVASLSPVELAKLRGAINMDMIAFDAQPPLSAVLETADFNGQMADQMSELAARYTSLTTQISYNWWGSDHVSFLKKNIPSVLTIESEYSDNANYHQVTDTPDHMNNDLALQMLRLNAASICEMAEIER
ncbi:MAG: M28 family peptidase [Candidatus Riflebacteria bacterium]|nr:M28 family peptidase [Candidatus Riflebacteria bacterium]